MPDTKSVWEAFTSDLHDGFPLFDFFSLRVRG